MWSTGTSQSFLGEFLLNVFIFWIYCSQVIATGLDLKFIFKAKHGTAAHQHTSKVFSSDVNCAFANGQMVWFCGCMFTVCQFIDGVDGWACLEWSAWLFQWRNGENQDSQRHGWCQSFGNRPLQIQRHLLHPSVGGLLRNICFVSFWSMKGGTSLLCPCPCVCLFCILDMLRTNLHPFTLSSLFYVTAGQSQAQIQTNRTQQRSPF